MKKVYLKASLFFVLGMAAICFALGDGYINHEINPVIVCLFLVGIICLIVSIVWANDGLLSTKKLGQSFNKSIFSFIVVCAVMVLWGSVNKLFFDHNIRFDVTANKQHTLNQETKALLSTLPAKIKLTCFFVGIPPKYLEDLMDAYQRESKGKIETEIVDPLEQLSYAAQFGQVINGKEKKLFAQLGKATKEIDFTDEPLDEIMVNYTLVGLTRPKRHAYFVAGHGEYRIDDDGDSGLSRWVGMLALNGIKSDTLLLNSGVGIPRDCDLLVIAGPKEFYSKDEIAAVENYLHAGGDAFIMVENVVLTTPDKPLTEDELKKNPSLNEILNDWGVNVNDDIAIDLTSHAGDDVGSPATRNYLTHRAIVKGLDYTFYVRPRSISVRKDRRETVRLAPLVYTASKEQSWGETNRMLQIKYDEGIDKVGPIALAYVVNEPQHDDMKSSTRLIVFTDADFLSNLYVGEYSNAQMGINVVNWLTDMDFPVMVGVKKGKVPQMNLISHQKRLVVAYLLGLPAAILCCGVLIFWRRRFEQS